MTIYTKLFTPSNPALMSAPSKRSFSNVSCPILAWSILRSGAAAFTFELCSNTSIADSCYCCFHSEIWFGCTSNCSANSASVLSPFNAAIATLALNPAAWFLLVLLILLLLFCRVLHGFRLSKINTYPTVRICEATSINQENRPSRCTEIWSKLVQLKT